MSDSDSITRLNAALEGRYRIERELGEGGMATVYLAADLKHERKVALKVLKPELAAVVGAERFLAEIKTTANLQHPHILPLFDSGEADGFLFYVMPFVEGESLRDRLDRENQLPVEEAVRIASDVAEALDYAHRRGVIHRDIKPANVLLAEGRPEIADFGIALALGAAGGDRLTETGLSMGTPHYMSPEQATGDQNVGPATDIYALGCVLYEMLIGEPPFTGSTPQAVLGKIIIGEPASVTAQRKSVPANVDAAIGKALERLPADRFSTAEAFGDALQRPDMVVSVPTRAAAQGQTRSRALLPWAVAAFATVVAGMALWGPLWSDGAADRRVTRLTIDLPAGQTLATTGRALRFALSPEGDRLVYAAREEGATRLYLRRLDSFASEPIEGTEGAVGQPFFSPDGNSVGFFQDGMMKRVSLSGGSAVGITEAVVGMTSSAGAENLSASWGSDDVIVYTHGGSLTNLYRVGLDGGEPELLVRSVIGEGYWAFGRPEILPDGDAVLFTSSSGACDHGVAFQSLEGGRRGTVLENAHSQTYVASGHIVYARDGALLAVPLDAGAMEVRGREVSLVDGVQMGECRGAQYAVSLNGTLAYVSGSRAEPVQELVWLDRDGAVTPISSGQRLFMGPHVSPDGRRLVMWGQYDTHEWVFDLERETFTQLTTEGQNFWPIWSPDGSRVTFPSMRPQGPNLFMKPWDGSEPAQRLTTDERIQQPMAWLPDESALIFQQLDPTTGFDILLLPMEGDQTPEVILGTPANEFEPTLSPDGRWLAYASDESGDFEIYVVPFPGPGGRMTISTDGGHEPVWAPDGSALFYLSGDRMMTVPVSGGEDLFEERPRVLFELDRVSEVMPHGRSYDISPDGERFVWTRIVETSAEVTQLNVVLNWFEELKERVPN